MSNDQQLPSHVPPLQLVPPPQVDGGEGVRGGQDVGNGPNLMNFAAALAGVLNLQALESSFNINNQEQQMELIRTIMRDNLTCLDSLEDFSEPVLRGDCLEVEDFLSITNVVHVFTQFIRPVIKYLRKLGWRGLAYIYDFGTLGTSYLECLY